MMNNVTLRCVDTFKHLGVRINSKLKWGDHVPEVSIIKANRALSLLRQTMLGCSKEAKMQA